MRSALIVAPPRKRLTSRETLRIANIAAAAVSFGWGVSVLVDGPPPLLRAALPRNVAAFGPDSSPLSALLPLPARIVAAGKAAMRRRRFDVVHGVNEGADAARSVARAFGAPYVAEWIPFPEDEPPPRVSAAAFADAAAVLLSHETDAAELPAVPNPARVSVVRDPHEELPDGTSAAAEFGRALEELYRYCIWKSEK